MDSMLKRLDRVDISAKNASTTVFSDGRRRCCGVEGDLTHVGLVGINPARRRRTALNSET